MNATELSALYRDYIGCLNRQDWSSLGEFVADDVHYNGELVDRSGYRVILDGNYRDILDFYFNTRKGLDLLQSGAVRRSLHGLHECCGSRPDYRNSGCELSIGNTQFGCRKGERS